MAAGSLRITPSLHRVLRVGTNANSMLSMLFTLPFWPCGYGHFSVTSLVRAFTDGLPYTPLADDPVGSLHQIPLCSDPPQLLCNGAFARVADFQVKWVIGPC